MTSPEASKGPPRRGPEEERYRYEGTGKNKQKTQIRREQERFKELVEPAKKQG